MKNKTKRIIGLILLFLIIVIIKITFTGVYSYHFFEELLPVLIVFGIVTLIIMIIPLIIRLINRKRISYKKGKIICIVNSLILFIIFSIPNIMTIIKFKQGSREVMSVDPISLSRQLIAVSLVISIIFYFINMCFFVDNKRR